MKKLFNYLIIASLSCCCFTAKSQSQEEMKAMMAYMTPGQIHQMMAKSTGDWTGVVTMWAQPGAAPMTMTCTSNNKMILDGRYLVSTAKGTIMNMPFEGISTTGYDNAKKVFVNSWIDNMGTGMMHLEGTWDAQTNAINFSGTMVDPASGKDVPVREVMKFVDDKSQVMEMYGIADGKEYKSMEIKYSRK